MLSKRVALVIVNYNSASYLAGCLGALSRQRRMPDKVVVVDNNSTDDSWKCVEQYPDWLLFLPLEHNTGFAVANNIAISYLQDYDYIALLNPDTLPDPGWLEALMDAVEKHDEGDCFGSRMLSFDDSVLDGTGDAYHVCGLYWREKHGKPAGEVSTDDEEVFSACAAAALYPTKRVTDLGGFDESYFCYSEDIDLGFRLRARGARFWSVPAAVVRHAGSATTGKHSDFTVYHGHRNLVWTYIQNMPGRYFWIHLPEFVLINLVTFLHFSLRGQIRVIFRSKWHALRGIGRAWRKRRLNRQMQTVTDEKLVRPMKKGLLTPYLNRYD